MDSRDPTPADSFDATGPTDLPSTREGEGLDEGGNSEDWSGPSREMGRYLLLRPLGEGGMGTVYVAKDSLLDREVALKMPRPPRAGAKSSAWLARFHREARIAAGFRHPDLCPVYDIGEYRGVHFLTMPLIPGESLADRLKRVGRVSPEEAVRLAARLARAMQVAHSAGVLHRDLKPANVMLRPPDDDPMIMDFGLAVNPVAASPRMTVQGAYIGTPAYSSPEQLSGEWSTIGAGSDVYSLGVILYQLLTGQLPFSKDWHRLRAEIESGSFELPSALAPNIPERLDQICRKALNNDPNARFASMAELAEALDRESVVARSVLLPPAKPPRPRRDRSLAVALGLIALLALGFVTYRVAFPLTKDRDQIPTVVIPTVEPPLPPPPSSGPSASSTSQASHLEAGSRWVGQFRFRPRADGTPVDLKGAVELRVTARSGDHFQGVYRSENRYEWEVDGDVEGDEVHWSFTRAIADAPHKTVVGGSECRGRFRDGRFFGEFINHQMNMTADMEMDLIK